MTEYTSKIKLIASEPSAVYKTLADLSNLEKIKDKIPADTVKSFTCSPDSCSVTVDMAGTITLNITEREPFSTIKFESEQSPIAFHLWIQLKEAADQQTYMKLTLRADLNVFIKGMIGNKLQEGLDKMADILATATY